MKRVSVGGAALVWLGLVAPAVAQTSGGTQVLAAEAALLRKEIAAIIAGIESERAALGERASPAVGEDALGVLVTEIIFQTGDVTIAPDARQRLAGVAEALHRMGAARVHVVGYSDRTGPQAVNAELALDRASAVAAILDAAGLPKLNIEVVSALDAGLPLPVPTPEGVAEPRNRSARVFAVPAG